MPIEQQAASIIGAPGANGLPGIAVMMDHELIDFYTDPDLSIRFGDIFYARVDRVVPELNVIFVNLNGNQDGFLPFSKYTNVLSPGDKTLVQVTTEPQDGDGAGPNDTNDNNKLARLTRNIALRGRYFVLFPNNKTRLSFSKRLADDVKQDLGPLINDMDLPCHTICRRSAGVAHTNGINPDIFAAELDYHRDLANQLNRAEDDGQIGRVVPAPSRLAQAIIDYAEYDLAHIDLHHDMNANLPAVLGDIGDMMTIHDAGHDVFDHFDIWSVLTRYHNRRVQLSDGVSIIADDTAVGLVIDVDSAGDVTPLSANQTALDGVFRLARVRNAGGIILVDGINLNKSESRRLIRGTYDLAGADPARATVHGITKLGLIEITRQQRFASGLGDFLD